MDKALEIQKQIRDNAKTVNNYLTDLQNWEIEMKRKEAALNGQFEQDLPPVRSKASKEKPVKVKKKEEKRIRSSDYQAWEKFDVDKACEEVDMEDKGPTSLDSKKSEAAKLEKLREEAQYEKERGNAFVKENKWEEAISCYNRAIELVDDDAIYYANRGLCYLKLDRLVEAERDCSAALRLDPTYVKALQRRSSARAGRGALSAALDDARAWLQLQPRSRAAADLLQQLQARCQSQSNSSPASTPTSDASHKSVEETTTTSQEELQKRMVIEEWKEGGPEKHTVIKPAKKPPHLRSKRPLKSIPIKEIQLGETPPDRQEIPSKILDVQDTDVPNGRDSSPPRSLDTHPATAEYVSSLRAPNNSVQFMAEWKYLHADPAARAHYLSLIDPAKLPTIFANALESAVVSDILRLLQEHTCRFSSRGVARYLRGLAAVKRFSALAMFLSVPDKLVIIKLLDYCKKAEKCTEEEIADLKIKYEL